MCYSCVLSFYVNRFVSWLCVIAVSYVVGDLGGFGLRVFLLCYGGGFGLCVFNVCFRVVFLVMC